MKKCSRCQVEKEKKLFYSNKAAPDGLCNWCAECKREHSKTHEYNLKRKIFYLNSMEAQNKRKDHNLKKKYDITLDIYNEMLKKQNSCCKLCRISIEKSPKKILCVDHDHKTGQIRGLLCHNCNRALGLMKDSSVVLRSGADYIDSFVQDPEIV